MKIAHKLSFIAIAVIFLVLPKQVDASNFFLDAHYQYKMDDSGLARGEIDVVIENATSERMAKSYLLNLHNFEPTNIVVKDLYGNSLKFNEIRKEGNSILEIEFQNPEAGLGKKTRFSVVFDSYTLAKKIGDTWDISVPKVENTPEKRNYSVSIQIPDSFGEEAFVSPQPSEKNQLDNHKLYKYSKNKLLSGNINLTFGEFQTYLFSLKYHLENPEDHTQDVELAIPPDTAYQSVIYENISPAPLNVEKDRDGNWIAKYRLGSGERLEVSTKGYVNIFPIYRRGIVTTEPSQLLTYTKKTQYWNTEDPQIRALAEQLKTPEAIYNFVVSTLTYNYDRMYEQTNRLGAVAALNDRENALCMEFTDLFITLARASGIPAREINGYAYSNNQKIQPLSLVTDVLHAWPEYWDTDRLMWVQIDPTWESTTGGRDYFNTFDVNHFTFVTHGTSDTTPYPPGAYKIGAAPQKDLEITISEVPPDIQEKIEIENDLKYKRVSLNIPFTATIINKGNSAVYDKSVYIYQDNEMVQSYKIGFLPPYGKYEINEKINYGLFAAKAPANIKIVIDESESNLATHKNDVLIFHVLVMLVIFSIIIFSIVLKLRPSLSFHTKIFSVFQKAKIKLNRSITRYKNRKEPIYHRYDE